jgi:hypothetical protein
MISSHDCLRAVQFLADLERCSLPSTTGRRQTNPPCRVKKTTSGSGSAASGRRLARYLELRAGVMPTSSPGADQAPGSMTGRWLTGVG